jgi:hypothetical protein
MDFVACAQFFPTGGPYYSGTAPKPSMGDMHKAIFGFNDQASSETVRAEPASAPTPRPPAGVFPQVMLCLARVLHSCSITGSPSFACRDVVGL